MMQQPPTCGGAVHPSSMNQKHPQPAEEEEEEVSLIWIGDLQHWMDKVEDKKVRTLWIGYLAHWMDEAYIDFYFSPTEEVFTIKLFRKGKSDKFYGFIEFKSRAIAENFLHKFYSDSNGNGNGNGNGNSMLLPFTLKTLNSVTSGKRKNKKKTGSTGGTYIPPTSIISQKTTAAPYFPKDMVNHNSTWEDMVNHNSTWEDMLKWWSLSQLDGSCTTRTVHAANRVYEIAAIFQIPFFKLEVKLRNPTELQKFEALLDELPQYVDSIDIAKEFHSMGALESLLSYLTIKYGGIPAKVVKVVSAMVQNNPSSQKLVMEAGGYDYLFFALFSFDDPTLETKALDAISLLFQDNTPGITAFRQQNGYASLIYALDTFCEHSQRKTVKLINCLLCHHISDCNIVIRFGYHRIMIKMASSYYAEVREAALRCLLLLARFEGDVNSCRLLKNSKQLRQALPKLIERICATAFLLLGAETEEMQLLYSLWTACYTEPCSLGQKGLLVLPGEEDAPACDVG